jgi:hypothetical protein
MIKLVNILNLGKIMAGDGGGVLAPGSICSLYFEIHI